jgi:hypothetical protein
MLNNFNAVVEVKIIKKSKEPFNVSSTIINYQVPVPTYKNLFQRDRSQEIEIITYKNMNL